MRAPRRMWPGICAALLAAAGCGAAEPPPAPAADPAPEAAADCAPVGEIRFICDLISPRGPGRPAGEEWVIASGNQEGGMLHLVNVGDKTSTSCTPPTRRGSGSTPRRTPTVRVRSIPARAPRSAPTACT